jgi:MFS family permease
LKAEWRTRNLKVLTAVSFTQDAASELLYPLLPIFLTTTLGAPPVAVGAIEGTANGVSAITKMVAGRLSDRVSRKPLIAIGYGLAAIGKVLVVLAVFWPLVLLGRVVDRLGKGVRSAPRDALLVEGVEPRFRGRVIGFHRTGDTLGAVVGPLLGLAALTWLQGDLRAALWFAVIPAVLSVVLVAWVRDPRPAPSKKAAEFHPTPLPRRIYEVIAVLAVFALVNFPDALLLLRAYDMGFSATQVILIYVLFNLSYAVLAFPIGLLNDRLPRHLVYALGLVAFAAAYVGLAFAESGWQVILIFIGYGFFAASDDAGAKSWISVLAPNAAQGWAQGLFQGTVGIATLIAGVWAGLTWNVGPGHGVVPLVISGTCALVIAGVLVILGRRWAPDGAKRSGLSS